MALTETWLTNDPISAHIIAEISPPDCQFNHHLQSDCHGDGMGVLVRNPPQSQSTPQEGVHVF